LDLRELREKTGLRREQVAATLGKSHTTISNWETGRFVPTLTPTETRLALEVYRCTLAEFEQAAIESSKNRQKYAASKIQTNESILSVGI
jgi:transcriptional regulator with XRE-family HTH domain